MIIMQDQPKLTKIKQNQLRSTSSTNVNKINAMIMIVVVAQPWLANMNQDQLTLTKIHKVNQAQ